jgi:hypothetical protein
MTKCVINVFLILNLELRHLKNYCEHELYCVPLPMNMHDLRSLNGERYIDIYTHEWSNI